MTSAIAYQNCLNYMFGLQRFGIILGLSTIQSVLQSIGNPHQNYKCIHIAGTNGKGSIASSLSTILHEAGYTVGLYTSPHLVKFNERICINGQQISDDDVVDSFKVVKNAHSGDREPTFFEYSTAMALYEFGRKGVEWAVIETGMGGRLDATNIIQPEVSIITNLSIEHKEYLGNTLSKIAFEKGGIIKQNTPVITGVKQKQAISVLHRIADEKKAPLFRLGDDFRVRRHGDGEFTYLGMGNTWKGVRTGLKGHYQVDNAAITLAVCECLIKKGVVIPLESIKKGIEKNKWPGRLEVVSTTPHVIMDGAHNLDAVKHLAKYLREIEKKSKLTLVTGILDDKPYAAMLNILAPLCGKIVLTQPKIKRSLPPEVLYAIVKDQVKDIKIVPDVGQAVNYAMETATPDETICIAGSLYVVGEAKEALDLSGKIN